MKHRTRLIGVVEGRGAGSTAGAICLAALALIEHLEEQSRKDTQIHLLRDQVRRLGEEPEE